ncbi:MULTISPECIES: beta-ketoacyl synthase N-terminal-like domain-containing protein [Chryseobacterium]|uniref:beta-ketoacyl synthase N-terminal-like domain-containing protein n=1 Tax=Chryseobacterium TaxID=59732 RepID=UPI00195ED314|nr:MULTISPECIES: beta-ketoacyl synthase N-terminal-like domain-containing protein [Chryseobacterium]MBM7418470.1 3-oxoacyl-[acyl-carrier-protein] synthase-1 [Chryseobacterium sp. JUb44]MDH6212684.1 3-oxoacyl-(acyl-carrier-protein) synthase [Chryseobacterium sp. BIGb0186]WSO11274.1 beta-ketoacyl synthase N-terminal-like domain-containing protein [Chryseobacterium scophthalmum]
MMKEIYITDYNCITPLGFDVESNWKALLEGKSGVALHQVSDNLGAFFVSKIDSEKLEEEFKRFFDSAQNDNFTRLEKMFLLSLKPLVERHHISDETAFILSTTKGNISLLKNETNLPESVYLSKLAQKLADFFGFKTKPIVVSNACVSGVMAISVAKNMIQVGKYKDAFVIAGDEISEFVISGFNSFQAIGSEPCKPYDKNRNGINLGEATAAMYITSTPSENEKLRFKVLGDSAINDANHISGPSRTGDGLFASIQNAMKEAKVSAEQINFISAHGTATLYNDEMEAIAFNRMELQNVPLNSMKGYYGHCLGASGLLESIISMESALNNILIPSKNFEEMGVSQDLNIIKENQSAEIKYILKTASGFGGCNAAIVLEKA